MSKPTYEELEAQIKQLAAENAGLKSVVAENWNMRDVLRQLIAGRPGGVYFNKWEPLIFKVLNATPATTSFMAEVRNEAGARAVELFAKTLGSPYSFRDEKCYEDGFARAIEVVRDVQAPRFAAQLRKGAAQ